MAAAIFAALEDATIRAIAGGDSDLDLLHDETLLRAARAKRDYRSGCAALKNLMFELPAPVDAAVAAYLGLLEKASADGSMVVHHL